MLVPRRSLSIWLSPSSLGAGCRALPDEAIRIACVPLIFINEILREGLAPYFSHLDSPVSRKKTEILIFAGKSATPPPTKSPRGRTFATYLEEIRLVASPRKPRYAIAPDVTRSKGTRSRPAPEIKLPSHCGLDVELRLRPHWRLLPRQICRRSWKLLARRSP